MGHWWNDTDYKTEVLGVKSILLPLHPPQIPRKLKASMVLGHWLSVLSLGTVFPFKNKTEK